MERAALAEFDFLGVLGALQARGVKFILIGGLAARIHGSPTVTVDVDVCPASEAANLELLADVLTEMHARLRGVDEVVPFQLDGETLGNGDLFTFVTDLGAVDVLLRPAGTKGFEDLEPNAISVELDGMTINVASLSDLIRMKGAAGRPKDRVELEILGALRDHLEENG